MLASLLYPYDLDAPELIEGWLQELECSGRVLRYTVEGSTYLVVTNFLEDEKIDRPSRSKLPSPANALEDSTKAREHSLGTKDQGPKDQGEDHGVFEIPVPDSADARILCESIGIFPIRQQEEVLRLMRTYAEANGLTPEQTISKIRARCSEYDREASQLDWTFGSRHNFLMSGKWDDPATWPRAQGRGCRSVPGISFTPTSEAEAEAEERESYLRWQSMPERFRLANPWKGRVFA